MPTTDLGTIPMKSSVKELPLDAVCIDGGTQARTAINDAIVEDYAEVLREAGPDAWPFPPVDVFADGTRHHLADGFHRLLAALRVKRATVPCRIHKGTARDAKIFGMTANDKHGLRMSREDKRACVAWLLADREMLTQPQIAALAGVSVSTVKRVAANRNEVSVAGKATPPKQDSKGSLSPSAPIRGGNGHIQPQVTAEEVAESVESEELRPRHGAQDAKAAIKRWQDAIGRWLSGHPDGIDEYRSRWPGPHGDAALAAARSFYNSLESWRKALK